ncbi:MULTISPECIES: response regulator [unclassified Flavobacterium]|mgnify:CR=1 FL=1|jgi:CheY-like chemotaxis protein|uniref:response regulator n=1 Tax=unclassified Flavobacterium TaxID=196869 RepID=UPI00070F7E37|nr:MULTISPECIES: response regulator [unclassified Flavobacterium]KRD57845.1 hypothetical protein ASE40_15925 [Flavobacterium sp. Root935]MDQ1165560.1 CheY-like chemotaxis protein [Flavobacterium sp. SORGH_AS_0622]BDU26177.1 hypothetical protein FLGSB24_29210 [Flavobacterium sp. GSB-24]
MLRKEIFLVDDDDDDITNFMDAISSLNKEVNCRTAGNPIKALSELNSTDKLPDLILLDYNMPFINGLEFIRRLRSYDRLANIEVVMFSTPDEHIMIPWLLKNDTIVKYISKPDTFEELKSVLDEIL